MSTRRDFLKQAAAGAAVLSLGSLSAAAEPKKNKTIGPDDVIRIGIVGVNARGKAIAVNVCKFPKVEITCICDCDSNALEKCRGEVAKITGKTPDAESDVRKMVKRKDIDAVMIATPDHWHAPAALLALKAGKHVYLEKPTSYCPAENEMLLKAEKKYKGQVVIIGTQRRSWPKIVEGIERVRNGEIGEVHYAKSWYTANRGPIGKGKEAEVPANLNWELWQGPAPRMPYKDNIVHYNWHWFWHWGTGEALNNGTHFVDLVRWGLKLDDEYPTRVTSVGGRYHYVGEDDWETPDTQLITFQYGDKAAFSWEGRSCITTPVDGMRNGVAFYGTKGTFYCDGSNSYKITDLKGEVIEEVKSDLVFESDNRRNPSQQLDAFHFQNWFDAIRKGVAVAAPLKQGCISTTCMQLGNIAQRTGHSLTIDPANGHIVGDKDAQKLWSRTYEKGWAPKV